MKVCLASIWRRPEPADLDKSGGDMGFSKKTGGSLMTISCDLSKVFAR